MPGRGPGFYRVRRRIAGSPLVSILILTRGGQPSPNDRDILAECLGALVRRTTYTNYELVIAAESCTFNDHQVCEAGEIDVMPTERGPICATYTPEGEAEGAEGLSNAR